MKANLGRCLSIRRILGAAVVLCVVLVASTCGGMRAADVPDLPVRVIFDTDIGSDVDDSFSLAMMHIMADRGEIELLAISSSNANPLVAPYIRAVNRYYGREIPFGLPDRPANVLPSNYMSKVMDYVPPKPGGGEAVLEKEREAEEQEGARVVKGYCGFLGLRSFMGFDPFADRDLLAGEHVESAVPVMRRALASAPDGSVQIFMTGFGTNLPRLLDSPPDDVSDLDGKTLVVRKVCRLVIVGGGFIEETKPRCENNLRFDLPAARRIIGEWPTEIIWSGCENGRRMLFTREFLDSAFADMPDNPVYRSGCEYGIPVMAQWDMLPPLWAVHPEYFTLSGPGRVAMNEDGGTEFIPEAGGRDRIVMYLSNEESAHVTAVLKELVSQSPKKGE